MNQPEQPDLLKTEPTIAEIVSNNPEEFEAVLAREKMGEFKILSMAVGRHNAQWVFKVLKP